MKCIGIIGSRRRDSMKDYRMVADQFKAIYNDGDTIVSGGCSQGGDRFAEQIARGFQVPIMIHYAKWKKYGKSAGFIRNKDIAKDADILIVCVSGDRSGGSENTIKEFEKMGKQPMMVYYV
jgi:predicted Rossmann fold nucleotide-binding protein DprA/Smf involved in DNA uptake